MDWRRAQVLCSRGGEELAAALREHGESFLGLRDPQGRAPAHWAALGESPADAIGQLAARGADLEIRDNSGKTPLIAAALRDKGEAAIALVAGGAKVDGTDAQGRTALMRASAAGAQAIVSALKSLGASEQARDQAGKTAADHGQAAVDVFGSAGAAQALREQRAADPFSEIARELAEGMGRAPGAPAAAQEESAKPSAREEALKKLSEMGFDRLAPEMEAFGPEAIEGREAELARGLSQGASAILYGPAGSGKTTTALDIAHHLAKSGKIALKVPMSAFQGTSYQNSLAEKMNGSDKAEGWLALARKLEPDVVLVVDDAHRALGLGKKKDGKSEDPLDLLVPHIGLSNGKIPMLLVASEVGAKIIEQAEPSLWGALSREEIVPMTREEALEAFGSERSFAALKAEGIETGPREAILAAAEIASHHLDHHIRSEGFPKKMFDFMRSFLRGKSAEQVEAIGEEDAIAWMEKRYGVPKAAMSSMPDPEDPFIRLTERLQSELRGQDEILERAGDAIYGFAQQAYQEKGNPLAIMMMGPSGVGKSETAKIVSRELNMDLLQLDMSSYKSAADIPRVLEQIGKHVKENYRAMILLDEMDMAGKPVLDALMGFLDTGELEYEGERVKSGFVVVMATTNLAMGITADKKKALERKLEEMGASAPGARASLALPEKDLRELLREGGLHPPLLARLDKVLDFNHMSLEVGATICQAVLAKRLKRLSERRGAEITAKDPERFALELAKAGFDEREGARSAKGLVKAVEDAFAKIELSLVRRGLWRKGAKAELSIPEGIGAKGMEISILPEPGGKREAVFAEFDWVEDKMRLEVANGGDPRHLLGERAQGDLFEKPSPAGAAAPQLGKVEDIAGRLRSAQRRPDPEEGAPAPRGKQLA